MKKSKLKKYFNVYTKSISKSHVGQLVIHFLKSLKYNAPDHLRSRGPLTPKTQNTLKNDKSLAPKRACPSRSPLTAHTTFINKLRLTGKPVHVFSFESLDIIFSIQFLYIYIVLSLISGNSYHTQFAVKSQFQKNCSQKKVLRDVNLWLTAN